MLLQGAAYRQPLPGEPGYSYQTDPYAYQGDGVAAAPPGLGYETSRLGPQDGGFDGQHGQPFDIEMAAAAQQRHYQQQQQGRPPDGSEGSTAAEQPSEVAALPLWLSLPLPALVTRGCKSPASLKSLRLTSFSFCCRRQRRTGRPRESLRRGMATASSRRGTTSTAQTTAAPMAVCRTSDRSRCLGRCWTRQAATKTWLLCLLQPRGRWRPRHRGGRTGNNPQQQKHNSSLSPQRCAFCRASQARIQHVSATVSVTLAGRNITRSSDGGPPSAGA